MLELEIDCVLRLGPSEGSRTDPDFSQLVPQLVVQVVWKAFQLRFDVVSPFEILNLIFRQNVQFDEMLKSWEKPQLFKQFGPASRLLAFLLSFLG